MNSFPEILKSALEDNDFRRRQTALQEIMQQPASHLEGLYEALNHTDALVQRRAAQILGLLGSQADASVPHLIEALCSRRWTVREAIALALGQVGSNAPQARSALVRLALHDRMVLVREAAVRAIASLDREIPAACDDLQAALGHAFPRVRSRALRALAGFVSAYPELRMNVGKALGDSHAKVRCTAAEVLGSLGPDAHPSIPALLRRLVDGDAKVRSAAVATLARLQSGLSATLQGWLTLFLRPGISLHDKLREAVEHSELSSTIREAFLSVCEQRVRWHERVFGVETQLQGLPTTIPWESAGQAIAKAAEAAVAHAPAQRNLDHIRTAAIERELAWLIAWLWTQLQRT